VPEPPGPALVGGEQAEHDEGRGQPVVEPGLDVQGEAGLAEDLASRRRQPDVAGEDRVGGRQHGPEQQRSAEREAHGRRGEQRDRRDRQRHDHHQQQRDRPP
jgi:hypothetical protein